MAAASDADVVLALDAREGAEPPIEITLAQFRADNVSEPGDDYFDTEHAPHLRALSIGEKYEANEGAHGTWSATRVR